MGDLMDRLRQVCGLDRAGENKQEALKQEALADMADLRARIIDTRRKALEEAADERKKEHPDDCNIAFCHACDKRAMARYHAEHIRTMEFDPSCARCYDLKSESKEPDMSRASKRERRALRQAEQERKDLAMKEEQIIGFIRPSTVPLDEALAALRLVGQTEDAYFIVDSVNKVRKFLNDRIGGVNKANGLNEDGTPKKVESVAPPPIVMLPAVTPPEGGFKTIAGPGEIGHKHAPGPASWACDACRSAPGHTHAPEVTWMTSCAKCQKLAQIPGNYGDHQAEHHAVCKCLNCVRNRELEKKQEEITAEASVRTTAASLNPSDGATVTVGNTVVTDWSNNDEDLFTFLGGMGCRHEWVGRLTDRLTCPRCAKKPVGGIHARRLAETDERAIAFRVAERKEKSNG